MKFNLGEGLDMGKQEKLRLDWTAGALVSSALLGFATKESSPNTADKRITMPRINGRCRFMMRRVGNSEMRFQALNAVRASHQLR